MIQNKLSLGSCVLPDLAGFTSDFYRIVKSTINIEYLHNYYANTGLDKDMIKFIVIDHMHRKAYNKKTPS